ncbi:hypothetical protein GCM10010372_30490 [Streptomyces tauricus]|uniref:hypothetical protein n=1 Tax=Streptomyces tauricus TaxID=68274 RepID=UPI0016779C39|nr:hypothetical protein [Streptomyces tauricus]GHA28607.1 hypothetical protein GCM10010372_30490 [Streptomyces tauricus]
MGFPQEPLGTTTELGIGGVLTDVTQHAMTGDIITHTRGMRDEVQAVQRATCTLTLKSPKGLYSPRNPRSEYFEKIGLNTLMQVSVHAGQQRLVLPADSASAVASTPSATALNIAGDLDARLDMALTNWVTGQEIELCGKYVTTGNQRSWQLSLSAAGSLVLRASTDGAAVAGFNSTAAPSVPPSGRLAVRVTRASTTGVITFYTAPSLAGPWTQLGETVTAATGAVFASNAPLVVGDLAGLGFSPPSGSVYAFQLRDGIGGTVVANVDFTAATVGATSFVDATSLTWTLSGGASISKKRVRFVGEFSDWPAEWSGRGDLIKVQGEGKGILERMSQGDKAVASTLRRRVPSYNPVAYWPMEEGQDATSVYSPIAGVKPFKPSAFDFASDDTLPGSSPLPIVQPGASFVARVPPVAAGTWQVELVYNLDAMPVAETTLFEVRTTGTARRVRARVATNLVRIEGLDAEEQQVFTSFTTAPQFTGAWTRLQIKAVQSGGNVQYVFRWIVIGGSGLSVNTTVAAVPGYVVDVRSSFGTGLDGMRWGHLAVFNTETDTPFNSADQAFNGETAGARMVRLCQEEGVRFRLLGAASDTMRLGPQRPGTLLGLLQESADADGGIFGEEPDRLGLRYRPRATLQNQTPALTLPYGARGVARPLSPVEPDSNTVRNDVTVNLPNGSSGRARLLEGRLSVNDPPNGVGPYDESFDRNLFDDDMAEPSAYWLMHVRTWDEARYPVVTIKLHKAPQLIDTIVAMVEGDLVQIVDLPEFLPPGPVDLLVLGYTERIGVRTWEIDLVCAPAGPYQVGVLDDAVYGRLDTDGSELAAGVSASATVLSVAVTDGPTWITTATYPAEFPFDIRVGGEVMTVTGISGTSSPQSFTVVRAVNGVEKAQASETVVELAQPMIVSL